jgi:hypothetical protein
VRQFEFIQYDLGKHEELLKKLDNAIHNCFHTQYDLLYEKAVNLLQEFNNDMDLHCVAVSQQDFQALVMRGEKSWGIPSDDQKSLLVQFLLPKIIQDFVTDKQVLQRYNEWIKDREVC